MGSCVRFCGPNIFPRTKCSEGSCCQCFSVRFFTIVVDVSINFFVIAMSHDRFGRALNGNTFGRQNVLSRGEGELARR